MKNQELKTKLHNLSLEFNKNPNDFLTCVELGKTYSNLRNYDQALNFYQKAFTIRPEEIALNLSIGLAYSKKGEFDNAIYCYEKILNHQDNSKNFLNFKAGAYLNISNIYYENNEFDKSVEILEKAITLTPNYSNLYLNLSNSYCAKDEREKGMFYLEKAIEADGNNADAYYNLAEFQLLQGDFENGFKNYEYRILRPNNTFITPPKFKKPCWQGEDLGGKTLFVYGEQGIGDAIQFSRFFPILKSKAAKVIYNASPALAGLFKYNKNICPELVPISENLTDKDFESRFDYYIPLMSLAFVLGIRQNNIPLSDFYISPDFEKVQKFKELFEEDNGFKIGIKWRGNPNVNPRRAINLKEFYPLFDISGVSFYSFQKDDLKNELKEVPAGVGIVDLRGELNDFSDTAGALTNMDLLITNDSAMGHLGGAMGVKTLILLPHWPDWRWGLDLDTTLWYDSVKLFRQKTVCNWSTPLCEVKKEVGKILAEGKM